jgi:hypothetical protein
MRALDKQRKEIKLGKEDCQFIKNYRRIYRKVINEPKKRDNDNYIANAGNKTKASWQIINNETGKTTISNKNIELNWNSSKITNPQMVSEIFNTYFVDIAEKLTDHKDIVYSRYQGTSWKLNSCPNTLFLNPASEVEMKQIIN